MKTSDDYSDAQIIGHFEAGRGRCACVSELCREHGMSNAQVFTNGGPSLAAWMHL